VEDWLGQGGPAAQGHDLRECRLGDRGEEGCAGVQVLQDFAQRKTYEDSTFGHSDRLHAF
jgi:hypothetical protein